MILLFKESQNLFKIRKKGGKIRLVECYNVITKLKLYK